MHPCVGRLRLIPASARTVQMTLHVRFGGEWLEAGGSIQCVRTLNTCMGVRRNQRVAGIIAEQWRFGESMHLRVQRAVGLSRARGLIARPPLGEREAMFFQRCRSVHGAFMGRPIVVVFLDDSLRVTSVRRLRPWRLVADRKARHVLEIEEATAWKLADEAGAKNSFALRGASFVRSNP